MNKDEWPLMKEEEDIVKLLSEAYAKFELLPRIHCNDLFEFGLAIHAAQNILMARPTAEKFDYKPCIYSITKF